MAQFRPVTPFIVPTGSDEDDRVLQAGNSRHDEPEEDGSSAYAGDLPYDEYGGFDDVEEYAWRPTTLSAADAHALSEEDAAFRRSPLCRSMEALMREAGPVRRVGFGWLEVGDQARPGWMDQVRVAPAHSGFIALPATLTLRAAMPFLLRGLSVYYNLRAMRRALRKQQFDQNHPPKGAGAAHATPPKGGGADDGARRDRARAGTMLADTVASGGDLLLQAENEGLLSRARLMWDGLMEDGRLELTPGRFICTDPRFGDEGIWRRRLLLTHRARFSELMIDPVGRMVRTRERYRIWVREAGMADPGEDGELKPQNDPGDVLHYVRPTQRQRVLMVHSRLLAGPAYRQASASVQAFVIGNILNESGGRQFSISETAAFGPGQWTSWWWARNARAGTRARVVDESPANFASVGDKMVGWVLADDRYLRPLEAYAVYGRGPQWRREADAAGIESRAKAKVDRASAVFTILREAKRKDMNTPQFLDFRSGKLVADVEDAKPPGGSRLIG